MANKTFLLFSLCLLIACKSKIEISSIDMVQVKGGKFVFNCQYNDTSLCKSKLIEAYVDSVKDFQISKYEITVAQFKEFMDDTWYRTSADRNGFSYFWEKVEGADAKVTKKGKGINWKYNERNELIEEKDYNRPVTHVSWDDCVRFCKWRSKRTGLKYRLPTDEEWEYAARGGQMTKNFEFSGNDNKNDVAWNYYNSDMQIHNVGLLAPNELGIYDMCGNVWEWTTMQNTEDPDIQRVRGGSYLGSNVDIIIDWDNSETSYSVCHTGFRVIIED